MKSIVRKPEYNIEWEIEFFTGANFPPRPWTGLGLDSWEYPFD